MIYKHVCDRGADDIEVLFRAVHNDAGFVIRVSRMKRRVLTTDGRTLPLEEAIAEWSPVQGTREITVPKTTTSPQRTATVTLRYGAVSLPVGRLTPWLREHRPSGPLCVGVVELRELSPPAGQKPIRWVLYTESAVTCDAEANLTLEYYEQRWCIEEFHKALKTGCGVELRQLQTAHRLELMVAVSSVVATRLLQLKTAARETPERPARELVPPRWVKVLQKIRRRPLNPDLSIRNFLRELAGLGGFLGRTGDGEPGWITIWRGFEKLILILRANDEQPEN